jgi:hypothetical protein
LGYDWGQLAAIDFDLRGIGSSLNPGGTFHDAGTNIATVTQGPGMVAWATTIHSTLMQAMQLGLMCYDTGYEGHKWYTMINGTLALPVGPAITLRSYWAPIKSLSVQTTPPAKIISWNYQSVGETSSPYWYVTHLFAKLSEISAPPRSRPPYPMIPSIG